MLHTVKFETVVHQTYQLHVQRPPDTPTGRADEIVPAAPAAAPTNAAPMAPLHADIPDFLQRDDDFLAPPEVAAAPLTRAVVFEPASELRARQGLKMPVASHLTSAMQARCDRFWTNDNPPALAATGRIEVRPLGT